MYSTFTGYRPCISRKMHVLNIILFSGIFQFVIVLLLTVLLLIFHLDDQVADLVLVKETQVTNAKTSNEEKPKVVPKRKRKTNLEKALDATFEKFKQSSEEEFERYQYIQYYMYPYHEIFLEVLTLQTCFLHHV